MFLRLFKRLRPFALLLLLFSIGFIFTTRYFFTTKWKNEVKVNIYRPKRLTRNENTGHLVEINKHLPLLVRDFRKSLNLYKVERINFHNRANVVQKTSLLGINLVSNRNGVKQNIVCRKDLFLLIQVHSSPKNFMSRQAIRLSWGNMEHFIGDRQEIIGQRYKLNFLNLYFPYLINTNPVLINLYCPLTYHKRKKLKRLTLFCCCCLVTVIKIIWVSRSCTP